jgi:hypothetical protein
MLWFVVVLVVLVVLVLVVLLVLVGVRHLGLSTPLGPLDPVQDSQLECDLPSAMMKLRNFSANAGSHP